MIHFFKGFYCHIKAAGMILRHSNLWNLFFLSCFISSLFWGAIFGTLKLLQGYITRFPHGGEKVYSLMVTLGVFTFFLFSKFFTASCHEKLSRHVEEILQGEIQEGKLPFLSNMWRLFRDSFLAFLRTIKFFLLGLLAIALPMPWGEIITILIGSYCAAQNYMEYILARRKWSLRQKRDFLHSHFASVMGLGLGCMFLCVPPFIIFMAPISVVAGTLLVLEESEKKEDDHP